MNLILNILLLLCGLIHIGQAKSQTQNDLLELVKQLPEVQDAKKEIEIAKFNYRRTYAQWGPRVNISSELWKDTHPDSISDTKQTRLTIDHSLSLQSLLSKQLTRENDYIERASLLYEKQLQRSYFDAISKLVTLKYFKEEAHYLNEQEALAKEWQNIYAQRYKSGYVDQISMLRWEVAYDEHKTRQSEINSYIIALESELSSRNLLKASYDPQWGEIQTLYLKTKSPSPDKNFDILVADKNATIAEQRYFESKLDLLPDLYSSINYGKSHDSFKNLAKSSDDYYEMMFGIRWQVFNSGADYYDIKINKSRLNQSESRIDTARLDWNATRQNTQKSLDVLFKEIQTLEKISSHYKSIVKNQETLFKQGKADADQFKRDFDSFIFSQRNYLRSKRKFVETFFNFYRQIPESMPRNQL